MISGAVPFGARERASVPGSVQSTHGGFEWASGAIGAGGATVVLLLTAGGAVTLSRRHKQLA